MKVKFRSIRLNHANKSRLQLINDIIEEYQADGYVLTLRQLYYQLVSRDIIPNKQSEYSKLSSLLKEGRMAGIVDWDAIEDRLRIPSSPASFDGPEDIINACINQYALPRQDEQDIYIEVWVEKDALSGVLKRITEKYHIPILVNRGYSSASAMYDAYKRFIQNIEKGRSVKILYLGDYDPSGIDMIRDIKDRITEFFVGSSKIYSIFRDQDVSTIDEMARDISRFVDTDEMDEEQIIELAAVKWAGEKFRIHPIALTMEQIKTYNPPPNPAKRTDPRAKDFIKHHGNTSWEVDALRPDVLNNLLETAIKQNLDLDKFNAILLREKADIKKLKSLKKYL